MVSPQHLSLFEVSWSGMPTARTRAMLVPDDLPIPCLVWQSIFTRKEL